MVRARKKGAGHASHTHGPPTNPITAPPPTPPPPSFLQRCEHQAGSPLHTLAEAPLSRAGLEDFAASLAAHCRRVRQVHLQGNVVGRLEREALGKLKVKMRELQRGRVGVRPLSPAFFSNTTRTSHIPHPT